MNSRAVSMARAYSLAITAIIAVAVSRPVCGETTGTVSDKNPPPNVVFFLVDDMGTMDLGCYGSTFYETPNIDKLAAGAVRFTNAYSACPVCSPSRAAIMAGKYPARMGTTDYFGSPQPDSKGKKHQKKLSHALLPAPYQSFLDLKEVTLAEALKENGYTTFIAGKWHLGNDEHSPTKQGFDINKGGNSAGHSKTYFSPYNRPTLPDGPVGEYLTDRLATETVTFIEDHKDRPFFVYLPFYNVHIPLQGRPDLVEKYTQKRERLNLKDEFTSQGKLNVRANQSNPIYAAMVESVDMAVGTVLGALDRLGLSDNTIVIFTSDNGGLSTAQASPTSNLPLRAGKGLMYEGGIRVPLIMRWPGKTAKGVTNGSVVTGTDFYPTLLDIAGLEQKSEQHVDGVSFASILSDNNARLAKRDVFWHYPHYGDQGGNPASAIRSGKWKLIQWYETDRTELFNLEKDPSEKIDVSGKHPKRTKELKERLTAWLKSVGAKYPTPNPNFKKQ